MAIHHLDNTARMRIIPPLAVISAAVYLALARAGDLRERAPLVLGAVLVLCGAMVLAFRALRGRSRGFGVVLGAALAFRILAALGEPALSDDVYRYVWDGRVQLHGIHPYAHAPADPALDALRDADSGRINHPELRTIYPPLAQMLFLSLAAVGAGPVGFKLALGLVDFGVVLALASLLRRLELPRERVILYAWNPLAVLETAGSGHVEPLGVVLVVLAAGWIIGRRPGLSTLAVAGAVQAKLFPLVLVPGYLRRWLLREVALFALALAAIALPYAWNGPALGRGILDYAGRWEFNSSVFAAVARALERADSGNMLRPAIAAIREALAAEWIPWDAVYRWIWPDRLARVLVALALVVWVLILTFRPWLTAARESFLAFAGAIVLSPTVHPWYVLWVLPFAAAYASWPWLAFGAAVFLAYVGGGSGPPAWVPWAEYGVLFGLGAAAALARRRSASRRRGSAGGYAVREESET